MLTFKTPFPLCHWRPLEAIRGHELSLGCKINVFLSLSFLYCSGSWLTFDIHKVIVELFQLQGHQEIIKG